MSSAFAWETLFCGYRVDIGVNLCQVRHRWLDQSLGSWLSKDPIELVADSNAYCYVLNTPINNIDTFGLIPAPCWTDSPGFLFVRRGDFSGTVGPLSTAGEVGSTALITFNFPWATFPRTGPLQSCCCCTKVGLIQVLHTSETRWGVYSETVAPPVVDGSIPYRYSDTGNPCGRTAITMRDTPSASIGIWPLALQTDKRKYEVCAVCLEGPEGPTGSNDISSGIVQKLDSMVVYGCLVWGYSVSAGVGGTLYTRYIGGKANHNSGTDATANAVLARQSSVAEPPSLVWQQAVRDKYAINVNPYDALI